MKLLLLSLVLLSRFAFANDVSVEFGGTYENKQGCKVVVSNCVHYTHPEDNSKQRGCSFYIQKKELSGSLGKNGKVVSAIGNEVLAEDKGLRWSSVSPIPQYVNRKAEIVINKTFDYPLSYPKDSVSNFDIKYSDGVLLKNNIACENLELMPEEY